MSLELETRPHKFGHWKVTGVITQPLLQIGLGDGKSVGWKEMPNQPETI